MILLWKTQEWTIKQTKQKIYISLWNTLKSMGRIMKCYGNVHYSGNLKLMIMQTSGFKVLWLQESTKSHWQRMKTDNHMCFQGLGSGTWALHLPLPMGFGVSYVVYWASFLRYKVGRIGNLTFKNWRQMLYVKSRHAHSEHPLGDEGEGGRWEW